MKKFLALFLALTMLFSLIACGSETQPKDEAAPPVNETPAADTDPTPSAPTPDVSEEPLPEPSQDPIPETSEEVTNEPAEAPVVEVDKNLFSVELTIPADFVDEGTTQESLNAMASEEGFRSATLNADGSVTYIMTKDQHKTMMDELKASLDESLAEMVTSGDYPSIVEIKANEDYTAFDVFLSTDTVGLVEGFSVLGFYMYGGMYNVFNGSEVDNISVSFINQATGEVIQTANSKDAA